MKSGSCYVKAVSATTEREGQRWRSRRGITLVLAAGGWVLCHACATERARPSVRDRGSHQISVSLWQRIDGVSNCVEYTNHYSVNNTRTRREVVGGQLLLEKTICCNVSLPFSLEELVQHMLGYQDSLIAAGVAMPKLVDIRVDDGCVVVLCEDGGANLVDRYVTPERFVAAPEKPIAEVVAVLKKVIDAGLSIDPHVKNFVGEAGSLLYVDMSPPLTESYVAARLALATGATGATEDSEYQILKDNFSYFQPEFLPYHFAGDFLNVDPTAEKIFPEIHSVLRDQGLIEGVGLDEFAARAKGIRELENLRLSKGFFMI